MVTIAARCGGAVANSVRTNSVANMEHTSQRMRTRMMMTMPTK